MPPGCLSIVLIVAIAAAARGGDAPDGGGDAAVGGVRVAEAGVRVVAGAVPDGPVAGYGVDQVANAAAIVDAGQALGWTPVPRRSAS